MSAAAELETVKPAAADRAASVQRLTTKSGIEVWLVEDYAVPLVALEFAFDGGAAQDAAERAGCAYMLAGLLDEGAGDLDAAAFQEALDEKAIELSFNGDRDAVFGRLRTLAKNVEAAFDLLRLAVTVPRLDTSAIERVRTQIEAGLRREAHDPDSVAGLALNAEAFPDHPYGRPVRGSLATIGRISRDDLVSLQARLFARRGLKIAAVGAIDSNRLIDLIDRAFGTLRADNALQPVPNIVMRGLGQCRIIDIDLPQTTIRFGLPGIDHKDPDFVAATVVNHILGGGVFSARLFKEVREKRGLAYSVYTRLTFADHATMLTGGTSTKNERAKESLDVIEAEIAALAQAGPSDDELEKAKKFLIGSYPLRFDTSTKIAGELLHLRRHGYEPSYLDERTGLIANVTLEDAKRVARRLFAGQRLLVAAAGRPIGLSP
jgi:zinc protease